MKLEYIADAFESGLLLLHSGSPVEVAQLRTAFRHLSVPGTTVSLHDLGFVEAVANCELTATTEGVGRGVRFLTTGAKFLWVLSPSDWERAQDLLEPFCHRLPVGSGANFQYLHEHGGVEVVYSTAREW